MSIVDEVRKKRTEYRFLPGTGYILLGNLPLPAVRIGPASVCEAPAPAAAGSSHFLQPPIGAEPQVLKWHPDKKEWEPGLGAGKRVAFSSAYLAACGWTYSGPA